MADTGHNVLGLILERAALRPNWPAVIDRGKVTSYGELVGRVNGIAALLAERKVGAETPVGICADRSIDWVAGLLGVLQSGGIYVPVNPIAPMTRKLKVLEDGEHTAALGGSAQPGDSLFCNRYRMARWGPDRAAAR